MPQMPSGPLAGILFLATGLVVAFYYLIRYRMRLDREIRARLDAWADREGFRIDRAFPAPRLGLPAEFRGGWTRGTGVVVFRVRGVDDDGVSRSGYVSVAIHGGAFAPAEKVAWNLTGPSFDTEA